MKHQITPCRCATIALCIAAPLAALAQAGTRMIIFVGGKSASADVRTIDGSPYVRLSDIASALHATLAKQGGTYTMVPNNHAPSDAVGNKPPTGDAPGGANQINGLRGKIGDQLMTGKYRFQVLDMKEVASYTEHYTVEPGTVEPKGDGDKLILINCLVKNARNEKKALNVSDTNTALTDEDGQSYPPLKFDIRWHASFNGMCTEEMLPGASVKFAVLFSVPKDTKVKDLVFTLADLNEKGNDVRITLSK